MSAGKNPTGRDWQSHPPLIHAEYKSTVLRNPLHPLLNATGLAADMSGPVFGHSDVDKGEADLTANGRINGEPIGERIIVTGKVTDENGQGVPATLIEIWQANAAGRYIHRAEVHDAPLDPNFFGAGRTITDQDGKYRFITIKPGSYPWGNHPNAWRPAHIHFSLIGPSIAARLVTQMYFEGDPTFPFDPIFNAIADAKARERLIAHFSLEETEPGWAHCYHFDIVLRGSNPTPFED